MHMSAEGDQTVGDTAGELPLIAVPEILCNTTHIPTGSANSPHTAGGTAV